MQNDITLGLPTSVLARSQYKSYGPKPVSGYGPGAAIWAHVRYDDECGNGHNSFAITGTIRVPKQRDAAACGCLHNEIAEAFPELAPLIKWHLCSSDGPLHYVANTLYHAGDRDHNGLRKGEKKPLRAGGSEPQHWELVAVNAPGVKISDTPTGKQYVAKESIPLFILTQSAKAETEAELPPVPVLRWVPRYIEGKGKERDLAAARSCAIWPDATDEQLCAEPDVLKAALLARLPALMQEFKAAVESLGFTY